MSDDYISNTTVGVFYEKMDFFFVANTEKSDTNNKTFQYTYRTLISTLATPIYQLN